MQKKKNSDTFASLSDRRQGCLAIREEWHLLYQECFHYCVEEAIDTARLKFTGQQQLISSADS
jgi:hypothetical protein